MVWSPVDVPGAPSITDPSVKAPRVLTAHKVPARLRSKRGWCGMRQVQISKKPRVVAARLRRRGPGVLPLDLRDPDIVRAKQLQRKSRP